MPDYSQKFEDELHKVQEKAILLYEMLETVKPGDSIERNDTIVVKYKNTKKRISVLNIINNRI